MRVPRAIIPCVLAVAGTLVMVPAREAGAIDPSGGVSVGGLVIGATPRLAIAPHAALGWRMESGLLIAAREVFSILPAVDTHGVGVYSQTSVDVGYARDKVDVSLGPSLAIYSMPACSHRACARAVGLAPGGHAQVRMFFTSVLGLSISGGADWLGGSSVLAGDVVATIIAGPVVRWRVE